MNVWAINTNKKKHVYEHSCSSKSLVSSNLAEFFFSWFKCNQKKYVETCLGVLLNFLAYYAYLA